MENNDITRVSTVIASGSPLPISFVEREKLISKGLRIYVKDLIGDYLDEDQIDDLVGMLEDFRRRPAEVEFSRDLCRVITEDAVIRNRYIPRKLLRKDETAILLYNLSPYALLNRVQAAMMAKYSFPNFFATVGTINSTFTKFQKVRDHRKESHLSMTIRELSVHSTEELELLLMEIALRQERN